MFKKILIASMLLFSSDILLANTVKLTLKGGTLDGLYRNIIVKYYGKDKVKDIQKKLDAGDEVKLEFDVDLKGHDGCKMNADTSSSSSYSATFDGKEILKGEESEVRKMQGKIPCDKFMDFL